MPPKIAAAGRRRADRRSAVAAAEAVACRAAGRRGRRLAGRLQAQLLLRVARTRSGRTIRSSASTSRQRAVAVLGQVADVAGFVGQERRVRREDAVLGGQRDQLVHQLLVAAFEVELVDDLADAARGPQLGDEGVRVVVALVDELGREVERFFVVADLAA